MTTPESPGNNEPHRSGAGGGEGRQTARTYVYLNENINHIHRSNSTFVINEKRLTIE